MFGVYDFLPSNFIVKLLASTICKTPAAFVCDDVLFLIAGFDIQHFNKVINRSGAITHYDLPNTDRNCTG